MWWIIYDSKHNVKKFRFIKPSLQFYDGEELLLEQRWMFYKKKKKKKKKKREKSKYIKRKTYITI